VIGLLIDEKLQRKTESFAFVNDRITVRLKIERSHITKTNVYFSPTKKRRGKWWVRVVDLGVCTVHLGHIELQCTSGNGKGLPKIMPKFSACKILAGGPW
jgi:hypothetical protein